MTSLPPLPPVPRTDMDNVCIKSIELINKVVEKKYFQEKFWGEILERTLSSNSLNLLQRTYGQNANNSISKIYLSNTNSDINLNSLINDRHDQKYLSNSEPKLCEHDLHDINCAKNKAFFGDSFYNNKFDGLPNI